LRATWGWIVVDIHKAVEVTQLIVQIGVLIDKAVISSKPVGMGWLLTHQLFKASKVTTFSRRGGTQPGSR
jgi:hypothetical protein